MSPSHVISSFGHVDLSQFGTLDLAKCLVLASEHWPLDSAFDVAGVTDCGPWFDMKTHY